MDFDLAFDLSHGGWFGSTTPILAFDSVDLLISCLCSLFVFFPLY